MALSAHLRVTEGQGASLTVEADHIRIDITIDPSQAIPVDETDKELMEMVIAVLLANGMRRGKIRTAVGRGMVWAIARHIRFALETDQPTVDFLSLPITTMLPAQRRWLAGVTAVKVA